MPQGGSVGAAGAGRRNYTPREKTYTMQAAKDRFIELIQTGMNINPALEKVDRSRKTYEKWRQDDAEFAKRVDIARQLRAPDRNVLRGEKLGFAEWRKKYLGVDTPWHQMQWVDLLEGREPRDLHESQTYEPGKRGRILVNCPPFHGKSVAITIDYVTYRLCMDPGFRVLLISAGASLAEDFLFGVKQRLTSPDFADLQKAYAPEGGWEATAESWTSNRIVFGSDVRAQSSKKFSEKDANVMALGMRSKVYGRRADLVVVDDAVDTTNVAEHGKQMKWLRAMVESRIEGGGKLLVIGTRVAPMDLYSELRNPDNYSNGKSPWTYLASPAILEEGATPEQHKTLWPYAQEPWVSQDNVDMDECLCERRECSDGLVIDGERVFQRWDGLHLEMGPKAANSSTDWALVYQQESVSEDATFPEHAIRKSTTPARLVGLLQADRAGHPFGGMHNKYVIAGLDPAIKGFAGIIVYAVDKETQKRYILNVFNLKAPTGEQLKQKMKDITEEYGVAEWRVEKTGLLQFFTQDAALRMWFTTRGVRFTEHTTGCVPTDVDILTKGGWKRHDQLAIGEDVLTHNGWEPLQDITVIDAPEKVYRVESQNLSCDFTPEHRHLVRWQGNRRSEERFVTTDELKSNTAIRLTIDPVGNRGTIGRNFAALLGWYMTEGHERKTGGAYIHQSRTANPEKFAMIRRCLDELGWEYTLHDNGAGVDSFYIPVHRATTLRTFAPGKNPRLGTIGDMDHAARDAFMEAALLGDGHGETFFSTDLEKVEAFEMAAVLNGFAVRRFEHENGNGVFKKNKVCWGVRRKRKKYAHVAHPQHPLMEMVDGEGQMWCPTTPSGTWVARSNGRSFVTGNSNKWDPSFGVSSLAPLFGVYDKAWNADGNDPWRVIQEPLIDLPRPNHDAMKALIHQLVTWTPDLDPNKVPCDLVMALWFAEVGAREYLGAGRGPGTVSSLVQRNKFMSPRAVKNRTSVSLADYRRQ